MLWVLLFCSLVLTQPTLPLPSRDIPKDLSPPLDHGRVSVHGWLWLPTTQNQSSNLSGWFYHHTPEFYHDSPHNFEIMVQGHLLLDKFVPGLPFPPSVDLVGTEYVFTPPEFSLDDVITSTTSKFYGKFSNSSFDTPQRYILTHGSLFIDKLIDVHYLDANATAGFPNLVYLSFPRSSLEEDVDEIKNLYFLHLLEKSPDFDQIVHITINVSTCIWADGQTAKDISLPGATFVFPSIVNSVETRLFPSPKLLNAQLITSTQSGSQCQLQVIEEIHCVVVPDSFANCPHIKM